MELKHTPGPWVLTDKENEKLYNGIGELVWTPKGPGYGSICECGGGDAKANARLIAAVPEMLEVLINTYTILSPIHNQWEGRETEAGQYYLSNLKFTIEKATGQKIEDILK